MAAKHEYKFKVGDTVEWSSQSGGHVKKKVGRVVCRLDPHDRAFEKVKLEIGNEAWDATGAIINGQNTSFFPRYLIEVARSGKAVKRAFYTPNAKTLDRGGHFATADSTSWSKDAIVVGGDS